MIPWQKAPFFRPAIVAVVSVSFYDKFPLSSYYLIVLSFIMCIALLLSFKIKKTTEVSGFILLIAVGAFYAGINKSYRHDHLRHYEGQEVLFHGIVTKIFPQKKYRRLVIDVKSVGSNMESINNLTGKVLIYPSLEDSTHYSVYDTLLIKGRLDKVARNTNPRAFDYSNFLSNQGIGYQCFPFKLIKRKYAAKKVFSKFIFDLQERSELLFHTYIQDTTSLGIVSAMVLGNRTYLPEEVASSFIETGAIHTLAVSGLHVGIVGSLVMMLLKFFPTKKRFLRFIYFLLSASCIWVFALLAGGRPSVIRASLMFTLFIFDFYLSGHRNSYNFLAFSALAMLAFDPNAVFDIGFQFSFLALMGILLFYKPISRLWPFKKIKIIRYGWNLMAVSIAAQTAVAPLSIYYFHQFPFYFWLSSLWAIPWTYVIVMLGMLLLLSGSHAEFLAKFISGMIDCGVELLMGGINWVHSLPYGHVSGIWIEKSVLIITYASILLLVCYVYFKKQWALNLLLMGVLSIGIIQLVDNNIKIRQSGITVYDVNSGSMIDLFEGNKVFTLKSKMISSKQEAYIADGNRQSRGTKFLKAVAQDSIISENNFYSREGIVILGHKVIYIPGVELTSFNGKIDYLVLTQNCHISFDKILNKFSAQKVIIDHSFPRYIAKSIIEKVKMHKIDVHDVQLSGAIDITW